MKTMGVRELRTRMSEVLREVREGETIQITSHGEAIALMVPVRRKPDPEEIQAAFKSLDEVAAEIGKYVNGPIDAAQVVSDLRRELPC